jgi:hypothetical protein
MAVNQFIWHCVSTVPPLVCDLLQWGSDGHVVLGCFGCILVFGVDLCQT